VHETDNKHIVTSQPVLWFGSIGKCQTLPNKHFHSGTNSLVSQAKLRGENVTSPNNRPNENFVTLGIYLPRTNEWLPCGRLL